MPLGLWIVMGVVVAAVLFALDRLALAMIRPPKKIHARNIDRLAKAYSVRPHSFRSLGQELQGWFVEPRDGGGKSGRAGVVPGEPGGPGSAGLRAANHGPVAVLAHGWGSSHGRMTYLAEPLLEAGIPVFLFDIRRHGHSYDAPYVTARHFRDDTVAAVREARAAYPGRPLVLMGHSMGGSAAVLAVTERAPVDALVTVGAPADMWGVWASYFDQKGLPGKWIVRCLSPFWRYRAGVPFPTLDPARRVKEMCVPFLIIHGNQDQSVPVSHARILAEGARVEPVILGGEGHNDILGKPEVHERVLAFVEDLG